MFSFVISKKIDKLFEVRVFYLAGEFYSMAIFSQEDTQTETDFRNYNLTDPNRTVPFILPDKIRQKLSLLMNKLDLNSGSIDIIVSKELKFYFLEINPIGQFGMVSYPCNYYLEKSFANILIS